MTSAISPIDNAIAIVINFVGTYRSCARIRASARQQIDHAVLRTVIAYFPEPILLYRVAASRDRAINVAHHERLTIQGTGIAGFACINHSVTARRR